MYVLVQHSITDPKNVWARAQAALGNLPKELTLHHCMPSPDGRVAVCIWEAPSDSALKAYLDGALGAGVRNDYAEVVNKEGIGLPTLV